MQEQIKYQSLNYNFLHFRTGWVCHQSFRKELDPKQHRQEMRHAAFQLKGRSTSNHNPSLSSHLENNSKETSISSRDQSSTPIQRKILPGVYIPCPNLQWSLNETSCPDPALPLHRVCSSLAIYAESSVSRPDPLHLKNIHCKAVDSGP